MANDVTFEGKERRMEKIKVCMKKYGIESLEAAKDLCLSKGIDVDKIVKGIQPIAFENASWAYTLGTAIALKEGAASASDAAEKIGVGLQAFCCRKPESRIGTRQPRRPSFAGRDPVLCISCRT
jgi:hypothetical protein